jgi:carboxymethylenebutenolidase
LSDRALFEERIEYPSGAARLAAYLARPAGAGPFPAVIVIHEIWGLDAHIEDVARRFAREGYAALAPDLYSRGGMPVTPPQIGAAMRFMQTLPPEARTNPQALQAKLGELPEAEGAVIAQTMRWLQTRDLGQNGADLQAALAWLARQGFVRAEGIASLGFCMGGGLAARLAASGAPLAACVIFYGENPPSEQIQNIRCPVLGLYGGGDHRITDHVPEFAAAMQRAGRSFEYHVYPGAPHAFFNDTRATYRAEAAADAWMRVQHFLHRYL